MRWYSLISFALVASASPLDELEARQDVCNTATCYVAMQSADSANLANANRDCSVYQQTLVTPCPRTRTRVSVTILTTTLTSTIGVSMTTASVIPTTPAPSVSKCTAAKTLTNLLPWYATGCGTKFADACTCIGIGVTTKILRSPMMTVTSTRTGTKTVIVRITPTKSVSTTTSKSSVTSVPSISTTSSIPTSTTTPSSVTYSSAASSSTSQTSPSSSSTTSSMSVSSPSAGSVTPVVSSTTSSSAGVSSSTSSIPSSSTTATTKSSSSVVSTTISASSTISSVQSSTTFSSPCLVTPIVNGDFSAGKLSPWVYDNIPPVDGFPNDNGGGEFGIARRNSSEETAELTARGSVGGYIDNQGFPPYGKTTNWRADFSSSFTQPIHVYQTMNTCPGASYSCSAQHNSEYQSDYSSSLGILGLINSQTIISSSFARQAYPPSSQYYTQTFSFVATGNDVFHWYHWLSSLGGGRWSATGLLGNVQCVMASSPITCGANGHWTTNPVELSTFVLTVDTATYAQTVYEPTITVSLPGGTSTTTTYLSTVTPPTLTFPRTSTSATVTTTLYDQSTTVSTSVTTWQPIEGTARDATFYKRAATPTGSCGTLTETGPVTTAVITTATKASIYPTYSFPVTTTVIDSESIISKTLTMSATTLDPVVTYSSTITYYSTVTTTQAGTLTVTEASETTIPCFVSPIWNPNLEKLGYKGFPWYMNTDLGSADSGDLASSMPPSPGKLELESYLNPAAKYVAWGQPLQDCPGRTYACTFQHAYSRVSGDPQAIEIGWVLGDYGKEWSNYHHMVYRKAFDSVPYSIGQSPGTYYTDTFTYDSQKGHTFIQWASNYTGSGDFNATTYLASMSCTLAGSISPYTLL